jgi:hypothetical protein
MTMPSAERLVQLRAAYPEGFLARRGVFTVGGWTCLGLDPWRGRDGKYVKTPGSRWLHPDESEVYDGEEEWRSDEFNRWIAGGDLLPDLTDPLTFQAALIDLAEAIGWGVTGNLAWFKNSLGFWDLQADGFTFATADPKKRTFCSFDTHDPIEALLLARAGLHSKEPTPP